MGEALPQEILTAFLLTALITWSFSGKVTCIFDNTLIKSSPSRDRDFGRKIMGLNRDRVALGCQVWW